MFLLPSVNKDNVLETGTYIDALRFCKKNYASGKCSEYYKNIQNSDEFGFFTCPFGLVSYKEKYNTQNIIFTSLRVKEFYVKKNKRFIEESVYNPILLKTQFLVLINNSISLLIKEEEMNEKQSSINSMAHEVKKLNSQIKENCDSLFNSYADKQNDIYALTPEEYKRLFEKIRTLYVISSMINSRYALYDYEKNPEILQFNGLITINIYKKFDKCSKILKNYKNKNNYINLNGSSYKCFKAYTSFEFIPLLLIENALKYSLDANEININFNENSGELKITIESFSPFCDSEDLSHIFEKGYRGKNAIKKSDGNGIGLYFVKLLCDLHHIEIFASSDSKNINRISFIPYSIFSITLIFKDVFDDEKIKIAF